MSPYLHTCECQKPRGQWAGGAPFLACAPGAVAEAKALVAMRALPLERPLMDATIDRLVARWESPEAAEGIAAFFGKRKPDWAR